MKRVQYFLIAALLIIQMMTPFGGEVAARQGQSFPAARQVDELLTRIQTRRNAFRQSFDLAVNGSRREDTDQVRAAQEHFNALDVALQNFRQRYRERRATASDVSNIMMHARALDQLFTGRLLLDTRSRQDWNTLSSELNQLAREYNLRENVNNDNAGGAVAQQGQSLPVTREVDQLLTRIQTRRNAFRQSLDLAVNRSRREDTEQVRAAQEHFNALDVALQSFRQRYRARRATTSDVSDIMIHARALDQFFTGRLLLDTRSRQDWNTLSSELNLLAQQYNLRANVNSDSDGRNNNPGNWGRRPGRTDPNALRLTGTYRLDATRSEDSTRVADRVTRGLPEQQQQRVRNMISRRLDAPDVIAIEREGRRITMVSSSAPAVTFEADGRTSVEQTPRGRTVRVSSTVLGDQLIVSQTGDRGTGFRVTFDPSADGRRLTVTRQMEIESLTQPVVVNSTYDKTSEVAQMDVYTGRPPVVGRPGGAPGGSYTVVDGTQLVATLNENLMTQQTKAGDRFTLTVQSPREYEGAIIEGYVVDADRSGRLAGRSEIALDFERIRLRNGSSHSFEGIIESVRTPRGDTVRVNNEGTVSEGGQTQKTVTRAGIGAAIGAIIGAITGGGSGAAIGAAVGAGAGAGSIIIEGRDDLELMNGTQFTIRASAPREASSR